MAAALIAAAGLGAVALRLASFDATGRSHLRMAERRLALGDRGSRLPDAPGTADGAASFRSALERAGAPGDVRIAQLQPLRRGEPAEDPAAIDRVLEANREVLADLHAAAAAPGLVFAWDLSPNEHYDLGTLGIQLAKLLELSGWRALHVGDHDEAVRTARTLARLSQAWFAEETWITGLAFERGGLYLLRGLTAEPGLPADVAAAAGESVLPRPRGDRELLRADAAVFERQIAELDRQVKRDPVEWLVCWHQDAQSRHWIAEQLHAYADLIEIADLPYPEWRDELARRRDARTEHGLRSNRATDHPGVLLRVAESNRAIARLALDLRLRAAETGRYPAELPEAAPAADPLGGQPWRYELRDDGGAELAAPGAIAAIEDYKMNPETWLRLSTWRLGAPRGDRRP